MDLASLVGLIGAFAIVGAAAILQRGRDGIDSAAGSARG